jgi:hypothetical protein
MSLALGTILTADPQTLQNARNYKSALLQRMFPGAAIRASSAVAGSPPPNASAPARGNVIGVGYGAKVTYGSATTEDAVRVYVRSKRPKQDLLASELVPEDVNGTPTDVIAVGDIRALQLQCGTSAGHFRITAGTLGCLVQRTGDTSATYILSNNHVLADSNAAALADDIYQPGPIDGGRAPSIAKLTDFEPLDFTGADNSIDAAIARLISPGSVHSDISQIGAVQNPPVLASMYQSVRKTGRTTNHTVGVIVDLAADIWVGYGVNQAWFVDQLAVVGLSTSAVGFSQGGDSGSLVVDAVSRSPVGLLFAGGGGTTFVNPVGPVLARFGVQIL